MLAHAALDGLRRDDFPTYRPHIAVPEFWWGFMQQLGPGHVLLELGPLMLMDVDK